RLDMERAGARGDQLAVAGHWLAGGEVAPGTGGTAPVQRRVALEAGTEEVEAPVAGGGPVVIKRIDAGGAVMVERQGDVAAQVVGVAAEDAAHAPVAQARALAGTGLHGHLSPVDVVTQDVVDHPGDRI